MNDKDNASASSVSIEGGKTIVRKVSDCDMVDDPDDNMDDVGELIAYMMHEAYVDGADLDWTNLDLEDLQALARNHSWLNLAHLMDNARDPRWRAAAVGATVGAAVMAVEVSRLTAPTAMLLWCPGCGERHVDSGDFMTKVHHTHACQSCGMVWRPAIGPTVGVQFLPGFKDL